MIHRNNIMHKYLILALFNFVIYNARCWLEIVCLHLETHANIRMHEINQSQKNVVQTNYCYYSLNSVQISVHYYFTIHVQHKIRLVQENSRPRIYYNYVS